MKGGGLELVSPPVLRGTIPETSEAVFLQYLTHLDMLDLYFTQKYGLRSEVELLEVRNSSKFHEFL